MSPTEPGNAEPKRRVTKEIKLAVVVLKSDGGVLCNAENIAKSWRQPFFVSIEQVFVQFEIQAQIERQGT